MFPSNCRHMRQDTCGDAQALCDSGQCAIVLLARKHLQAVLLRPLAPHVLWRLKAGAPVNARAPSQCRACQDVDA